MAVADASEVSFVLAKFVRGVVASRIRGGLVRSLFTLAWSAGVVGVVGGGTLAHAQPAIHNIGVLTGGSSSNALAVSANGAVVAGRSGSSTGNRAIRWTVAGGLQSLGVLAGGDQSWARAISA